MLKGAGIDKLALPNYYPTIQLYSNYSRTNQLIDHLSKIISEPAITRTQGSPIIAALAPAKSLLTSQATVEM
ncbi:hypothetical protein BH10CYA1_BH10CYA1_26080 [soil metagenome]